jgi:UDP-N-acetyl-D-galactosamine dehydrogenase
MKNNKSTLENKTIAIIGLGYVGLPLAVEFSKKFKVQGFDINAQRISQLKIGIDTTLEIEERKLKYAINNNNLSLTNDIKEIQGANIFIVTVPTPIDKNKRPDLTPLLNASKMVATLLKKNDIVVYESTVYPGATEEFCVPILEEFSKKKINRDFFVGYSPERINPGDKKHTLLRIQKITSGSNKKTALLIDKLYSSIITAGTFMAPSIKVAEAAKVIENSQRDINIAFVNELSKIFNLLKIDTNDVLDAACTKWNFLNFRPGLVGGHCIGVDPYYLAQKAQEVGYNPEIILAGRRLNDSMGKYVATEVVKLMLRKKIKISDSKVLILGFTFKENCPDIRNTRVIDIYDELIDFNVKVDIYDPLVSVQEVKNEYNLEILNQEPAGQYSVVILAVAHKEFFKLNIKALAKKGIVYDVKGILSKKISNSRL